MPPNDAVQQDVLRALRGLAELDASYAVDLAELERRLREDRLRVLVVGEAKRGKSTLVNRLVGREILPTGVVPVTSVATTLSHGAEERLEVSFRAGHVETQPLAALADLVTQSGNPDNGRGVAAVTAYLRSPLLAAGVELVDTPGVGSVHGHNTLEAQAALDRMDAAVFVVAADPPISDAERAWLRVVRTQAVQVFCVLNKADYLSPEGLEETVAFTRAVVRDELGGDVPVWPLSARSSPDSQPQAGWEAFEVAFQRYVATRRRTDLVVSVGQRAARIGQDIAEQQAAALATLAVSEQELAARVAEFSSRLRAVERDRRESAVLARAEIARLTDDLTARAHALPAAVLGPLLTDLTAVVTERSGSPRDLEERGRAYLADRIRACVEPWRQEQREQAEAALLALESQLARRLDSQVQTVRDLAGSLFAVELLPLPATTLVRPSRRFSYAFEPGVGQIEGLTAAVRTRLPAGLGRRRVQRYLRQQAEVLLDRQIGRARSDLAERLRDTERVLLGELDRRFETGAGRIADAVRQAAAIRTASGETAGRFREAARACRDAAAGVAGELARLTAAASGDLT